MVILTVQSFWSRKFVCLTNDKADEKASVRVHIWMYQVG